MESEQESPRPLLTPGEILQLPGDDALVMIGGLPPYRAKKIMYYQDERLMKRAWLPTPDDPEAQQSELLSEDCRHNPWLTDSGVAGQAVAEHQEHSDSQHGMKENVATPVAEQHDVTGEISVESAVPENTLLVEEPEITRTIDRANNRAGIIDLSRTPQGGHLPL